MTANPGERAALDFGDIEETSAPQPPPVDLEAVKETAAKAGFRGTTPPAPSVGGSRETSRRPRRLKRRRTGRIHQFATRLNEQTLNAIYETAEQQGITLAEVIERAMAALRNQSK
jgi:predicted DNA binding CopG/RHH family protein